MCVCVFAANLVELYYVWMVQLFHYFHLTGNLLQILFIQSCLVNDLNGNLGREGGREKREKRGRKGEREGGKEESKIRSLTLSKYAIHMYMY